MKAVAFKAFKVAYDRESGYVGYKVSGEEFKLECTKFDKVLLVFKDGTYKVTELPEKLYAVLERLPGATLLSCKLESGRTHQIRVHLQSIGHPLVGDPVYRRGAKTHALDGFKRQALHAARLELVHPRTGRARHWESPLPEDFRGLLDLFRNARPA